MEAMSSTSQKAAARVISVRCGAPRVSLRLQRLLSPRNPQCTLLPSSCTHLQQPPNRGSLLRYSGPQAWAAAPPTRGGGTHLHARPPSCLLYALLPSTGKQGRDHSNSNGWSSDLSFTLGVTPTIPSSSLSVVDTVKPNGPGEQAEGGVPDQGN